MFHIQNKLESESTTVDEEHAIEINYCSPLFPILHDGLTIRHNRPQNQGKVPSDVSQRSVGKRSEKTIHRASTLDLDIMTRVPFPRIASIELADCDPMVQISRARFCAHAAP